MGQGALFAQGCAVGHTDQRAQLHQGLVVVPGLFRRLVFHHTGGEGLFHGRFGDDARVVVQAGKHPQHVAVHGGHRDAEADGRHRPGRVVANAGQGPQGVVVGRQLPAVLRADDLCRLLQVAHPAVVAKALPELVQLFFLAGSQRRNIRQRGEKALVVGQGRRHAGLLQHDLAEPDVVRGGVLPEGQDAAVLVEPFQQCRGDVFHLFCAPC